MNTIPCNVVLLPDDKLTQHAITTSQTFAAHDPLFTLELGKFYPHMSIYMFQLDVADIPKVEAILKELASNMREINGAATTYQLGEGFGVGYVDPEYEVTEELRQLQDHLVDAINPIRSGMRENDKAKLQDATGLKLENLKKYGYPAVGELFRPHITLTRLKEHTPEALDSLPDINTFSGTFDRLGLFEMGDNGTCIRKISEFNLQP